MWKLRHCPWVVKITKIPLDIGFWEMVPNFQFQLKISSPDFISYYFWSFSWFFIFIWFFYFFILFFGFFFWKLCKMYIYIWCKMGCLKRYLTHWCGLKCTKARKYCWRHRFRTSVCPSVCGWYAILTWSLVQLSLNRGFEKFLMKIGSQLEIMPRM